MDKVPELEAAVDAIVEAAIGEIFRRIYHSTETLDREFLHRTMSKMLTKVSMAAMKFQLEVTDAVPMAPGDRAKLDQALAGPLSEILDKLDEDAGKD